MSAGRAMRGAATALFVFFLWLAPAAAHDAVDATAADEIVTRVGDLNAAVAGTASTQAEAETLFDLGATVSRAIDLVNRDLAAHPGNAGIISTVLVARLKVRGVALAFSPPLDRYKAYLAPFERYLALAPEGPRHADAMFRVLYGRFYDGFDYDPFDPLDPETLDVAAEIDRAETFLASYPDHPEREEALFILAVNYARAYRFAAAEDEARTYFARARTVLAALRDGYPDGLRAAAAGTLIDSLPALD